MATEKRGTQWVRVVSAAVVAVGVLAGLTIAGFGPFAGSTTLIVGDSVTNLSRVQVEDTTGATVNAQNGYTWAQMAPKVRGVLSVMGETPDRVGVLLGYNDVLQEKQDLEATTTVLGEFSDVECVVVMQLPKLFNHDVDAYNDKVQAIVDELPNASTDDGWAKVANGYLDNDAEMLAADLVHPNTDEAKQAVADSYVEAFDRLC